MGGGEHVEGPTSPWARGGEMSEVRARQPPSGPAVAPTPGPHREHPAEQVSETVEPERAIEATEPGRSTRGRLAFTGAVVAALAVGIVIVRTLGGGDDATAPSTTNAAPLVESTLPSTDTAPANDQALQPTSEADGAQILPPPGPSESFVEVPDSLVVAAPTEVVALHPSRGLIELQFPSGRLRSTWLPIDISDARLAVNDAASLVWWPERSDALIVRDGRLTPIEARQPIAQVSTSAGLDSFVLWSDAVEIAPFAEPDEAPEPVRLGLDGSLVPLPWAHRTDPLVVGQPPPIIDTSGALIEVDSGGVFRVNADGAQRITDGDLVAIGRNHRLVRECDTARRCGLSSQGDELRSRSWGDVEIDDDATPVLDGGLSPFGDALLVTSPPPRSDGTLSGSLQWVDLGTGQSRTVRVSGTDVDAKWSSDGGGLFFTDTTLRWFDRATGSSVPIDAALDGVRNIAVRAIAAGS